MNKYSCNLDNIKLFWAVERYLITVTIHSQTECIYVVGEKYKLVSEEVEINEPINSYCLLSIASHQRFVQKYFILGFICSLQVSIILSLRFYNVII